MSPRRPERVLVTGAGGFVGAALVAELVRLGNDAVALVRPGATPARLDSLHDACEIRRTDIRDAVAVERVVSECRPDRCFHLAAAGATVRSEEIDDVVATNALAPLTLARALERAGCRSLVMAGSSSEYGPAGGVMSESMAAAPDDVYGAAKLAGAALVLAAARSWDMRVAHLRLFSVYGPGEDPRRLVMSLLLALRAQVPIDLTPGEQVRDFVYLSDVVSAFLAAADETTPGGTLVNIGSGTETTVRRLAETAADVVGADRALLRFGARPYRPNERFSWRADTTRAAEALGWRATTSLRDGIAATSASLQA